jgi:hypothetical protein
VGRADPWFDERFLSFLQDNEFHTQKHEIKVHLVLRSAIPSSEEERGETSSGHETQECLEIDYAYFWFMHKWKIVVSVFRHGVDDTFHRVLYIFVRELEVSAVHKIKDNPFFPVTCHKRTGECIAVLVFCSV